jgi:hypothetical protein
VWDVIGKAMAVVRASARRLYRQGPDHLHSGYYMEAKTLADTSRDGGPTGRPMAGCKFKVGASRRKQMRNVKAARRCGLQFLLGRCQSRLDG